MPTREKSFSDLVESEVREHKPRRRLTLAERMKSYAKPWSSHRRKCFQMRQKRLKELNVSHEASQKST